MTTHPRRKPESPAAADAAQARQALHGLAHSTRNIDNPADLYPVLSSLTAGLTALELALHHLGRLHDQPPAVRADSHDNPRAAARASHKIAWELHHAAQMVDRVIDGLDRARTIESTLIYDTPPPPQLREENDGIDPGLSL